MKSQQTHSKEKRLIFKKASKKEDRNKYVDENNRKQIESYSFILVLKLKKKIQVKNICLLIGRNHVFTYNIICEMRWQILFYPWGRNWYRTWPSKQLENWTKYMKQLFSDIGQQIAEHCSSLTNELNLTCQRQNKHIIRWLLFRNM